MHRRSFQGVKLVHKSINPLCRIVYYGGFLLDRMRICQFQRRFLRARVSCLSKRNGWKLFRSRLHMYMPTAASPVICPLSCTEVVWFCYCLIFLRYVDSYPIFFYNARDHVKAACTLLTAVDSCNNENSMDVCICFVNVLGCINPLCLL